MGLFQKSEEERAEAEARKHNKEQEREAARLRKEMQRRAEEFAKSPAGQAKAARDAGASLFQWSMPLSHTVGRTIAMSGTAVSTKATVHASTLDSIEAAGWKLEHAAYVYQVTGSVSRDKFLSSGQQEAVHGEVIGIYIFRVLQESKPAEVSFPRLSESRAEPPVSNTEDGDAEHSKN
jgi:hypothetical protein